MIVRQYAPCSLGRSIICLGKQGEINALRVEFDVSAWMAMYPDATVKLMHFAPDRPQDNPVIPTLGVEGTLRVWIVGEEDTAGAGNGVIELLLIDERTGSTIKSATGYTTVLRSPSAGIEAQEPEPGYVRYDVDQSALLTDTQKAFARTNIDAIKDEKDPTVPDWAKQPRKPTYTASEVGALPSSYTPPVTSVNGMTGAVALSAQDVGARPDTWTPSASEVGADAAGTASGAVAAHNVSGAAHADLRALIEGLTIRLNALADSDDTTLDQLSEIVAYIKSNKALIDAVTTGKVSVSDIVDNLTTNASGKVLSAAQGVALKAMIDGIVIPTALPNPQPITINGQRYDGSDAVTVTTAEIDDTLTQSGKAADAKAVGDQLSALNEAKVNKAGWTAGKYLGTDADGNVVEKDAPSVGTVNVTPRMSNIINAGTIFEKPDGLPYCGWPFNDVQYDPDINSIVFLINAAVKHGDNGNTHLYMAVMSLDTYDVTIKEIFDPAVVGHGFYTMGFCINSAGEYLYVDAQSATLGKSTDKGATWTETDISAYNNWPESLTQLSNGRYLFWGDGSTKGVWYSDNDCETWTQASMSGAKFEGDFLELPEGVVMCFMRKSTQGTDNGAWNGTKIKEPIVISISRDYGTTWSAATDSTTLLEGCANIASAFYHADEDLVEIFTSPRYPFGDTYGAVFQYIAAREDALNDRFGEPKVVLYSKAHAYQDFGHIGGCFDNLGDLHLMYYDGDASTSGSVNYHYLKASRGQATLPLVKNGTPSIFLPCSGAEATAWLAALEEKLTKKINAIIIQGGGTVNDPDYYVTESLKFDFDLTDTGTYNVDNGTITDVFGNVMTLTFADDGTINAVGNIKIDKTATEEKLTDKSQFSVESYIDVPNGLGSTTNNENNVILSDGSYDAYLIKNRYLKVYYSQADGKDATNSANIGTWLNQEAIGITKSLIETTGKKHLVCTGDSNGVFTVYYNGETLHQFDCSSDFGSWNNAIKRGFGVNASSKFTPLYFRVYNKALTEEEVKQNYKYCKSLN